MWLTQANPGSGFPVQATMKRICSAGLLTIGLSLSLTYLVAQAEVHLREVPTSLAEDRFSVISVKQNRSGDPRVSLEGGVRGRYGATNVPAVLLLRAAHRVQPTQIVGLPGWAAADRWDVVATIPDGPPTGDRQMALLRNMLKDRFNLAFHVETRELPVYALVVARGGPKPGLRPSAIDCDALFAGRVAAPPGARPCGLSIDQAGGMRMVSTGQQMPGFVGPLAGFTDRLIVDRTGLKDTYEFELRWTPDAGAGIPGPVDPDTPGLFTALEEQLGLRLEPARAQVEVMVIDRFERPTEN